MLMGGVVVEDHVAQVARRDRPFEGAQEPDELLVTIALHASADDAAFQHPDVLLRTVPIGDDRCQPLTIRRTQTKASEKDASSVGQRESDVPDDPLDV